jgi:3-hydroxyacyl-CoA dehydrogenase/enoyl-CoA hydratase/3-hydroxybutyryl-CoA epimerase
VRVSADVAEQGKDYACGLGAKAVAAGRTSREAADALLARITTTASPADLAGVDLVIEAVFESMPVT